MSGRERNQHNQRNQRKLDHLRYFRYRSLAAMTGFDDIHFVHQALPRDDIRDISISCKWLGKTMSAPLLINALTGGPDATREVNAALARVARRAGIAMAVGSQKIALDDPALESSFKVVRSENPEGPVLANIGCSARPEEAARAVAMIGADALQVHLNAPQELLMAEGERDFGSWRSRLARICGSVGIPIIAKEIGFGLSKETTLDLVAAGVRGLDIGGCGGTDFLTIESYRSRRTSSGLDAWGIPTAVSLAEVLSLGIPIQVVATGGIRSPMDAAKALALGANVVGVAGYFLEVLLDQGEERLVAEIEAWKKALRAICLLVGAKSIGELARKPLIITGDTRQWLDARGIDACRWARR